MSGADIHFTAKESVPVETERGRALLSVPAPAGHGALHANWVPQRKSHCGCASAVIVLNAMGREPALTQDSFFRHEGIESVVPQCTVFTVGYTLDQLAEALNRFPSIEATPCRAGNAPGEHGIADFRRSLASDGSGGNTHLILNFSAESLWGLGTGRGHFTPVWDYNAAQDMLLILEVCNGRKSVWYSTGDVWSAMACTDGVSGRNRGWIVVRRNPT